VSTSARGEERRVRACTLPRGALLARYADAGAYADCYVAHVERAVSHAEYVEAFYTGGLFKLERLLLRLALSRPSTDEEARRLAAGAIVDFAAWRVEDRAADQLLMRDVGGRTRSWLMVSRSSAGREAVTRLYFGSAVVPRRQASTEKTGMGFSFYALLAFHKLYSRALLRSARRRLAARA
jgi:hypothetical protein